MAAGGSARWSVVVALGVVGLKVTVSAAQLAGQTAAVAITWLVTLSFVTVGVLLLRTDVPAANGWGCILVGVSAVPGDLNDPHFAGGPLTAVGFVLEAVYLVAASALVLRYPRPRLSTAARLLLVALLATAVLSRVGAAATSGSLPDGFHRPSGWHTSALGAPWHDDLFVRGGRAATAVLLVVVALLLGVRLVRAHGLSRQSQAPLVVVGMACALAAAADQLVWAIGTEGARGVPAALARNLSAALIPVALMADLLRRRSAGAEVSHRILSAAATGGAAQVQDAIRAVFVDPSATVELPDGRGAWLDTSARPVVPTGGGRRRFEVLELDDGGPLLRVGFDPNAVADEALISTALEAVRVGTHNTRLRTELLAAMSELGSSRERIVEAGLAERRRVERDLHDGAQQQLLAVAATLAQTDFVDDGEVRDIVSRARVSLSDALGELRALARGIHPPALGQGGLPAALAVLAERAPWPVTLHVGPECRRLPPTIEAAAYFVVAEVLTNAARHADAHGATVDVVVDGPTLRVAVTDDGCGRARFEPGGGLVGLRDRVHALGGAMAVDAAPGAGTAVRVSLPSRIPEGAS